MGLDIYIYAKDRAENDVCATLANFRKFSDLGRWVELNFPDIENLDTHELTQNHLNELLCRLKKSRIVTEKETFSNDPELPYLFCGTKVYMHFFQYEIAELKELVETILTTTDFNKTKIEIMFSY